MTADTRTRSRHPAPVLLLGAVAGYCVAAALQPPGESTAWPGFVAAMVAAAALAGACKSPAPTPGASPRPTRDWALLTGTLVVGVAADIGARMFLRSVTGAATGPSVPDGASLAVGVLVAGAWVGARRLAARVDAAFESRLPGDVRPVGVALLAGGVLVLAAAGVAQWRMPTTGWQPASAAVAAGLYAVVAGAYLQRLRRAALTSSWARSGRVVEPGVTDHWTALVVLLFVVAAGLVSLWWLPMVEPARSTIEHTPRETVERLRAFVSSSALTRDDLQFGGRAGAGESFPGGEPASTEDDRRIVVVGRLVDWLLDPVTEFGAVGDTPGAEPDLARWSVSPIHLLAPAVLATIGFLLYHRSRRNRGADAPTSLLRAAAVWFARLRAILAALARRAGGQSRDGRGRDEDLAPPPRAARLRPRRWLRPSTPREQVRFDYRRMLHQAARRGLPRRESQSPAQYADLLHGELPDHGDQVDELTQLFVEARYSHHAIDGATSMRSKEVSRTLRRALQSRDPVGRR